jgi:hypothetical protein
LALFGGTRTYITAGPIDWTSDHHAVAKPTADLQY